MKKQPRPSYRREVTRLRRRVSDMVVAERGFRSSLHTAEAAREFAEAVFQTVREPLLILDSRLRVLDANRAFYATFRSAPRLTLGRFLYDLGDGQWNLPRLRLLLEKILPEDRHFEGFAVDCTFPRIGRRVMMLNARRIRGHGRGRDTMLLAFEDVTAQRNAEEDMMEASVTDPLTGLRNRRGLQAAVQELARQSPGRRREILVLFLDVDNLKTVNDRLGHAAGDRLLLEASKAIRVTFPEASVAARVGGDEFVLVFADPHRLDPEALRVRLRRTLALDNRQRGRRFRLSISAGTARGEAGALGDAVARADAAMYGEKLELRRRPGTIH